MKKISLETVGKNSWAVSSIAYCRRFQFQCGSKLPHHRSSQYLTAAPSRPGCPAKIFLSPVCSASISPLWLTLHRGVQLTPEQRSTTQRCPNARACPALSPGQATALRYADCSRITWVCLNGFDECLCVNGPYRQLKRHNGVLWSSAGSDL